jgi:hypothetical protein
MKEMGIKIALGILQPKGDTLEDLIAAKRVMIKQWHPDIVGPNFEALEMSKAILEAFNILSKKLGTWSTSWGPDAKESTGQKHVFAEMVAVHDQVKHIPGLKRGRAGVWYWVLNTNDTIADTLKNAGLAKKKGKQQWYWFPDWSKSKRKWGKGRKTNWSHKQRTDRYGWAEMKEERHSALG